jgi:macrolide transport system ATP-binding/permease protein
VIEVRNLSHSYNKDALAVSILKNVSFDIHPGRITAIKGPSGSGKSTLLYLIGGFLKADAGRIRIDGVEMENLSGLALARFRSRKMGFIFQQFHLLPRSTGLGNITLAGKYPLEIFDRGQDLYQRALELSEQLGIADQLEKRPNQMSGGQQQRIAIARALFNHPEIILADEPTGSLDSKTAADIFAILKRLAAEGKSVVLITHDENIARQCDDVIEIKDGEILRGGISSPHKEEPSAPPVAPSAGARGKTSPWKYLSNLWPMITESFKFNRVRAFLTMLGVSIGIAALTSMITFGTYIRQRVVSNYEKMGVNKISLDGQTNWRRRAVDSNLTYFSEFDQEKDLDALKKVFPQISLMSPSMVNWSRPDVNSAGRRISGEAVPLGVGDEYFRITNRRFLGGIPISYFHVVNRSPVCVIGYEIAQRLFGKMNPVGNIIFITTEGDDASSASCRVIGVLDSVESNSEWNKPDYHILLPYTYFQMISNRWYGRLSSVVIQLRQGSNVERTVQGIQNFFQNKYGGAGIFSVNSDAIMVGQLKQFMGIFQLLLGAIAVVCLIVGGMGIANMMLASIGEQLREIGIRKSLGATDRSVYFQYLGESMVLCFVAGIFGILMGVLTYHAVIYLTSKMVKQVNFQWTFDVPALVFSFLAIFVVGILSGWVPALKARKLQVVEALRSE